MDGYGGYGGEDGGHAPLGGFGPPAQHARGFYQQAPSFYSRARPPYAPRFLGMGAAQGSLFETAVGALAPMLVDSLGDSMGIAGFTGGDTNIATTLYAREHYRRRMAATAVGGQADRAPIRSTLRGLYRLIGGDVNGPNVDRMLDKMSENAGDILPFIASAFPDMVDKVIPGGSIAAAAGNFVDAGRYLTDPATGQNMSHDAEFPKHVLEKLRAKGPAATGGMGAYRMSEMFGELAARGVISGSGDKLHEDVEAKKIDPEKAKLKNYDKIAKDIEDYSKTIGAIKDIFGSEGRSNVPMTELIESLNSLTGGGLGKLDPHKINSAIREMQGTMIVTGRSLEQMSALTSGAGALLQQRGLSTLGAGDIALRSEQGVQAAKDRGALNGRGYEAYTADELLAAQHRAQADGRASPLAQRYGALVRLAQHATPGSPLTKAVEQFQANGESRFTLPSGRTIDVANGSMADVGELLTTSGLTQADFIQFLQTPASNDKAFAYDKRNLKALMQQQGQAAESRFLTMLPPLTPEQQGLVLESLHKNNIDVGSNDDLGIKMAAELQKAGVPLTSAQIAAGLGMVGTIDGKGLPGHAVLARYSPAQAAAAERVAQRSETAGWWNEQLTHFSRGGGAQNFVRTVAGIGTAVAPGSPYSMLLNTLAGTLGAVNQADVNKALGNVASSLPGTNYERGYINRDNDLGPIIKKVDGIDRSGGGGKDISKIVENVKELSARGATPPGAANTEMKITGTLNIRINGVSVGTGDLGGTGTGTGPSNPTSPGAGKSGTLPPVPLTEP